MSMCGRHRVLSVGIAIGLCSSATPVQPAIRVGTEVAGQLLHVPSPEPPVGGGRRRRRLRRSGCLVGPRMSKHQLPHRKARRDSGFARFRAVDYGPRLCTASGVPTSVPDRGF